MLEIVDSELAQNDKLTAQQIKFVLKSKFSNMPEVSLATIKRARKDLGWVCTRPHYCQLLRNVRYIAIACAV